MKVPPLPRPVALALSKLQPYAIPLGVSAALAFLAVRAILADAGRPAMPLDDSFIHFVYARRFAEGTPFTFSPGDGFSSGATSFAWPLMLAPFYLVGFRGLSLVWVVWLLGTLLHAALAVETKRLVEGLCGKIAGVGAAAMCLLFGAFAWFAWSGMETIALAWSMTRAARTLSELAETEAPARSGRRALGVALICALCPLLRPEGGIFALAGAGYLAVFGPPGSSWRARLATRWLAVVPLVGLVLPPLLNLLLVGHARSTTAMVKWAWGNPYYDTARFFSFTGSNLRMLWNDLLSGGPYTAIFLPEHSQYVLLAGAIALVPTTLRAKKIPRGLMVALLALGTLIPCTFLTILWNRVRYIYPFAPGWFALVGCLGAELAVLVGRYRKDATWVPALVTGLFAGGLSTKLTWSIKDLANSSRAISEQQVKLGMWARDNLPQDALIGVNDTGAIAYFSERRTFDVVGLTTEGEAQYWVAGTGSRYEHYEKLPPERRPTHFIVYPQWMGCGAILGEQLFEATVLNQSILGGATKVVYAASWEVLGRADLPTDPPRSGDVIDTLDVADLESEKAHGYKLFHAQDVQNQLFTDWDEGGELADGGRHDRVWDDFDLELAPGAVLVARLASKTPQTIRVLLDGSEAGSAELGVSDWIEVAIPLAGASAGKHHLSVRAEDGKSFGALHYWVLSE